MTLYTQQERNIVRTYGLFVMFLVLVVFFGWIMSLYFSNPSILYGAVIFSVIWNFLGYWYSDKVAIAMSGARQVKDRSQNPYLWNMVENLSIAAGLPMPKVYTIPEAQINAFATGRNPSNASVAVTDGAIQKLENEELEGVLAHELAHIGNRDILVMTIAVMLAGAISMLADVFLRFSFLGGGRDNEDRKGGGAVAVLALVVAILAPLGAMMMQLAISRRREFLADATGSLITRYPEGLARALEKIDGDKSPMRSGAHDSTAHLFISNPFKKVSGLHSLFMTHPPIKERIAALRNMSV